MECGIHCGLQETLSVRPMRSDAIANEALIWFACCTQRKNTKTMSATTENGLYFDICLYVGAHDLRSVLSRPQNETSERKVN